MRQLHQATMIRLPQLLIRTVSPEIIAVRFWEIGGREQFMTVLGHFRRAFFLARPQKLDGLDWLILLSSQSDAVKAFCRKYGLRVVEDFS